MEEYANPMSRFTRFVEINIHNLAAVPSIVYGILGLAICERALSLGQSVITAGITRSRDAALSQLASRGKLRAFERGVCLGSLATNYLQWRSR
jgi:ABC-type phosphate transport system permease subunit